MEEKKKKREDNKTVFRKRFRIASIILLCLAILFVVGMNFYYVPRSIDNPYLGIALAFPIILMVFYLFSKGIIFKKILGIFFHLLLIVTSVMIVGFIYLFFYSPGFATALSGYYMAEEITAFLTVFASFTLLFKGVGLVCDYKENGSPLLSPLLIFIITLSFCGFARSGAIPNFTGLDFLDPMKVDSTLVPMKPVIYLYPEKEQEVRVKLDYQGGLAADYPEYDYSIGGWAVTAYPDGRIIDKDGKEYSYLFWEGKPSKEIDWDMSTGFVVKGGDTREFLQEKLSMMGLTPKEYNELIVYWYPLMKDNNYNLIHFAGKEYTDRATLSTIPEADSVLRVFMVYKALDSSIDIKEQEITPFERKGFSVVEWGGTSIR